MAFPADSTYVKYLGAGYHLVAEPGPNIALNWNSDQGCFFAQVDAATIRPLAGLCAVIRSWGDGFIIAPASVLISGTGGYVSVSALYGLPHNLTVHLSEDTILRLVPNE